MNIEKGNDVMSAYPCNRGTESRDHLFEDFKKTPKIAAPPGDGPPFIAQGVDMMSRARNIDPQWPCHPPTPSDTPAQVHLFVEM